MSALKYVAKVILPEGKLVYEYNPLYNYRKETNDGMLTDLITKNSDAHGELLNFSLTHPIDIQCLESYDGSINLILNDNLNQPRLINTRFTAKENNTYERVDRLGNTDTNIYDESEFDIDTSLLKKYINIPKVIFNQVYLGGNLPIGNYVFYFKLSDADGNETDIVAESGLVTLHIGALNTPTSIRGGEQDENSGKSVSFTLMNIDSGYDYVNVYFTRTTGVDNGQRTVTATRIENRFRVRQNRCSIHVTGNEKFTKIPVSEISQDFFLASKARTLAICLNMLFMGNVSKFTPDYETLSRLSLGFVPYYLREDANSIMGSIDQNYTSGGYYNTKNIYNKVGYWNEEIYRFGIVYIMHNGALSPVYNVRGINDVPIYSSTDTTYDSYTNIKVDYDTQIIKEGTLENSAGVCRINDTSISGSNYFLIRNFLFVPQSGVKEALEKLNIKGYFFVRQKRIPTILCQAFMLGRDNFSGIPCWNIGEGGSGENGDQWVTESFLDSRGYLTQDYGERLVTIDKNKASTTLALAPEYELNQPYFNNIFTGTSFLIKQQTSRGVLRGAENHMYLVRGDEYKGSNSQFVSSKIISVSDSGLVRDGSNIFRAKAGEAESLKYQYLCVKSNKPKKDNFEKVKTKVKFAGGRFQISTQTLKSKVRITRGVYGTYLGVYNIRNNSLETNSLINIYIPGYDVSLMKNYFNIRINCEDAYCAVTERKELTDLPTTGEKIYRGDCYISQFTHRLNRNFQDPDAPNNDTIIEEDTWVENYNEDVDTSSEINRGDLNAVRLGTYFTFRCYSSMNLAMRDWDRGFPSEESLTGNKRGFYPLQPIRTDGNYKIPESCIYNQGFSTSLGEKVNFLQPAVPFIKNCFQTRIVYSDIAQNDAFKNGFRVFRGTAFRDYSNQYGGIMRLVEWNDNLCVVFEHAVGIVKVNRDALIPTDDGTKIAVGAVKVLADTPIMLSTDFGTLWPESVCTSDLYIYGIDTVAKKIWRTNGQKFECISDFKVQKFLNDNITLGERELTPIIGVRNVKTHYNANKKDVMFTFYDNTYGFEEKVWNLCYNEHQEAFTTFYSWVPSYSANIDNIFFSYNRDTSKWLAKLGINNATSSNASGICCSSVNINSDSWSCTLSLKDRPLPTNGSNITYSFKLERDHWGNYQFFTLSGTTLTISNYNGLIANLLNRNPQLPVVLLNISCNISVGTDAIFTQSGGRAQWERYFSYNYTMYQSLVHLTFDALLSKASSLLNGTINEHTGENWIRVDSSGKPKNTLVTVGTYQVQRLLTDFWKHGQAGIIDVQERIKPCFWYGRQHPFEFEYIAGNDTAGYKRFDNLILSSNNVKPDSIHYTIVGDTYDFSCLKPAMYFRQEATKAFYQYNGSDILYDHEVFDKTYGYIPEMVTSSTYLETDRAGNTVRDKAAYSKTYKDTLMPLLYIRLDTFNEVEDYYKKISYLSSNANAYSKGDYPNLTGGEILWDVLFNKFSICNHVKARDVKEVGRTRANIQYINDKWVVQITPLNVYNRNGTWFEVGTGNNKHWLPKLVLNNVPEEVFNKPLNVDRALPPELRETDSNTADYKLGSEGLYYTFWDNLAGTTTNNIDTTPWENIANGRKEVKLMDKYLKTRIRYKGDELVVILATVTQFNTIG